MRRITTEELKVIECCICGITSKEHNGWAPCRRQGGRYVCSDCCRKCRFYRWWSGLRQCMYQTPEEIAQQRRIEQNRRLQQRQTEFEQECQEIGKAYYKRRAIDRNRRKKGK